MRRGRHGRDTARGLLCTLNDRSGTATDVMPPTLARVCIVVQRLSTAECDTMDECKLRMFDAKLHGAVTTCRRSCLHQRCPASLPRVSSRRLPL